MRDHPLLPVLLSLALLAAPVAGQERFSETIGVTEVEVPVRVLAKGRPVAGLTREDFEIYDGGSRREVLGFEVRDQAATERIEKAGEATRTAADPTSRRLLLLFDFGFAGRINLSRALRGVRTMVHRDLQPSDRVAVATWGPISGVNLLVGFTTDLSKVDLALEAVEAMLDAKNKRQREVLDELHRARFGSSSAYETLVGEFGETAALAVLTGPVAFDQREEGGVATREKRSWFGPVRTRVEVDVTEPVAIAQDRVVDDDTSTVRALGLGLAETASLLRDVGGQKEILLLTEGFGGALLRDARSLNFLQESFRALRDASWTLHAVDVRGLPAPGERTFPSNSLLFMARATGGDLVENVNDFAAATSRVLQRSSIVYLLSFQPDPEDARSGFRELDVELVDPPKGVSILHRPGYYAARSTADKEPYEQRVDTAEWLLTNAEVAELEVEVRAETVEDPLGGFRVELAVDVAGPSFMGSGRATRRLDLRLVARDAELRVREFLTGEARLESGRDEIRIGEGGVRFQGFLALAPGDYDLRVMVMGLPGGEVYLMGHALNVGGGAGDAPGLLPAPGERDPTRWLVVGTDRRSAFFR